MVVKLDWNTDTPFTVMISIYQYLSLNQLAYSYCCSTWSNSLDIWIFSSFPNCFKVTSISHGTLWAPCLCPCFCTHIVLWGWCEIRVTWHSGIPVFTLHSLSLWSLIQATQSVRPRLPVVPGIGSTYILLHRLWLFWLSLFLLIQFDCFESFSSLESFDYVDSFHLLWFWFTLIILIYFNCFD